jgi:hypothetical protein
VSRRCGGVVSRLVERPPLLTQAFEEPLEALVKVVQRDLGEEHAVQVDKEFMLGHVRLRTSGLMLLLEERQDRFASRQVRVCRGETGDNRRGFTVVSVARIPKRPCSRSLPERTSWSSDRGHAIHLPC